MLKQNQKSKEDGDAKYRYSLLSKKLRDLLIGLCSVFLIIFSVNHLPVMAGDRTFLKVSLDFVNEYQLPKQNFENTPVGGLSGLTYDRIDDVFYDKSLSVTVLHGSRDLRCAGHSDRTL